MKRGDAWWLLPLAGLIILAGRESYNTVTGKNQYLDLARKYGARYNVPAALIMAVIETESSFNPNAYRYEEKRQDASYGLMQVLYSTARGLGYSGTPQGLLDPETNINYGTAQLAWLYNQLAAGDWEPVIEAYNEGLGNYLGGIEDATYFARVQLRWEKWKLIA